MGERIKDYGYIRKNIELKFLLKKYGEQLKNQHKEVHLCLLEDHFQFNFGKDEQLLGAKAEIENTELADNLITHTLKWRVDGKEIFLEGFGKNLIHLIWRLEKLVPGKWVKMDDKFEKGRWIKQDDVWEEEKRIKTDHTITWKEEILYTKLVILLGKTDKKIVLSPFLTNRTVQLNIKKQDVKYLMEYADGRVDSLLLLDIRNEVIYEQDNNAEVVKYVEDNKVQ